MKLVKTLLTPPICAISFVCAFALSVRAAVICVDGKAAAGGDGSAEAPFQTIAEGVAAAQDHDIVELASGSHTVSDKVVIDKPITVRGYHAAVTVVRPAADGILVFQLNHADAVLEGVTVRDAKVSGSCSAVQVSKGTLQDAIVCNNTCTGSGSNSGAVWVGSAAAVVRRCIITDNVGRWGGGLFIAASGTVDCCHLTRNKAEWGGGIYINNGSLNPKVVHLTATGNTATAGNGGPDIYNYSGAAVNDFHDCYVVNVNGGGCTGSNNIIGRSAKADELRNAGAPVEGMSMIDVDGVPYDAETPSIGCRALVDDPVSVAWTGPTDINIGETYTVSGLVTGVPEGTTARCDLYASDGTWVAGSDTDELTFTVGTIPGAYTLVVGLSDGEMTRKLVRADVALAGLGTVHVSKTGSGTFPYGDEATAFTDIQAAIGACANGGTVIVHDGTYAISSTILVEKGITVRSANGRDVTRLERASGAGCRPLYINHAAAVVDGFTIAKGYQTAPNPAGGISNGGGVLIGKLGGTLDRCLVEQCVQSGVHGGALAMLSADAYVRRTILRDNEGNYGGAVYLPASSGGGTLESCLIHRNKASWGGGLYSDATGVSVLVVNCTILDNTQSDKDVYDYGTTRSVTCVNTICTQTGVKATTKCLTTAAFVDRAGANYMLAVGSTAIDAGASREDLSATDVAGNPRISGEGVDIGAYEYRAGELKVDASVDVKTAPYAAGMAFVLTPSLDGVQGTVSLDWTIVRGDGVVVLNRTTAAEPLAFEPTAPGVFSVKVVATDGDRKAEFELAAMFQASAAELFVGKAGGNVYPYASAADAATDINIAWDMAGEGTVVHVAEGRYDLAKTLNFDRGITLIGAGRDRTTLASSAEVNARVATLNHAGAAIRGCTLTGARIGNPSGRDGAGVYFGAKGGLLEDCRVTDNIAQVKMNGGGVSFVAGSKGVMRRCEIDHNKIEGAGDTNGGGIYMNGGGVLENCLVHHNSAYYGSGVFLYDAASITNCTIVANSPNLYCERSWDKSSIVNTICGLPGENGVCVYVSLIQDDPEAQKAAAAAELAKLSKPFYNCLSSGCYCFAGRGDQKSHPLPEEKGNLTGNAAFVDSAHGDYRLSIKSPCRGAGLLDAWMLGATDLDGNRRAYPGLVDMGCYQRIPKGLMLLVK